MLAPQRRRSQALAENVAPIGACVGAFHALPAWVKLTHGHPHAGEWRAAGAVAACIPPVFRSYSAYIPLVLVVSSDGALCATTESLSGCDNTGLAVIQTESRFYFDLPSMGICARRRHSW